MYIYIYPNPYKRSPHGVVANVLDCGNVVSKFKLQACCCVNFQTNTLDRGIKPFIAPGMGKIELPFFYFFNFGIK